jgi:hypothetical protein
MVNGPRGLSSPQGPSASLARAWTAYALRPPAECVTAWRSVRARKGLRAPARPRRARPAGCDGNGLGEERKVHLTFAPLTGIFLTDFSRGALRERQLLGRKSVRVWM